MKSMMAKLEGLIQYIEISLGRAFFPWWLLECNEWTAWDWIIVQLMLTKDQVYIISFAAILVGKIWVEAIGSKHSALEITECSIQS